MSQQSTDKNPPDKEIYGLKKAITTAWEELNRKQPDEVIKNTLCILGETSKEYQLKFLNENYTIKIDTQTVETENGEQFNNLFVIGIMLHYMTHAQDKPLTNNFISFRELWGGQEYYYAFNNRVLKQLTEYFHDNPESLLKTGEKLGGEKIKKGEYGIKIPALPRVPIYILFWAGDDEISPSANVLFDTTANDQMETEALVWLTVAMVSELRKCRK